jgi:hypothetical protein
MRRLTRSVRAHAQDAPEAERRSKDLEAEWLSRSALQQRRADILDLTVLTDSEPDVKPKLEPKEKAKRRSRPEVIDLSYL